MQEHGFNPWKNARPSVYKNDQIKEENPPKGATTVYVKTPR
jgi:hypothetical protein